MAQTVGWATPEPVGKGSLSDLECVLPILSGPRWRLHYALSRFRPVIIDLIKFSL